MNPELVPWLHWVATDTLPTVSVAVDPSNLQHVGIFFRNEDEDPYFLHLADHHALTLEPPPATHAWVASTIQEELLPSIAAMCETVWRRNGAEIPYGFRYDVSEFARDGTVVWGPDECGFTCATFVLAVLRSAGVNLLRQDEWPAREDDVIRFVRLTKHLRRVCTDQKHIDALEEQTRAIRFRPMEVAGASAQALPCGFAAAVEAAGQIEIATHRCDTL